MIATLTSSQKNALDRMARDFNAVYTGGFSQFVADVLAELASGNIGFEADPGDVDSIALGGGAFTWDEDNTSGLTFAFKAGRFHNGKTLVSVSAGTVALNASATNYVEVDRAGSVTSNTTAFTSGRMPLFVVVTGASAVSTVASSKPLMTLIGPNGVDGSMLSTPAGTKNVSATIGTVAATTNVAVIAPAAGKLSRVTFTGKETLAASDTAYYDFGVVNRGQGGVGTTVMVDRTLAANSTKATGGTGLTAYAPRVLTLVTESSNELSVAKGDVLLFTITKTGSPASETECAALFEFTFTN